MDLTKTKHSFKKLLLMLILTITALGSAVPVLAVDDGDSIDLDGTAIERMQEDKKDYMEYKGSEQDNATKNMLTRMFSNEIFSSVNLKAGLALAKPGVIVILTLSVALMVLAIYLFFGQTMLDVFALVCPPARRILIGKTMNNGTNTARGGMGQVGGNFGCLSDSCLAALGVNGSASSSGMNNGSDRAVKSAVLAYIGLRTKEMTFLLFFLLLIPCGLIGKIITVFYNLISFFVEALINFQ